MKIDPIAWRLRSQQLVRTKRRTPADIRWIQMLTGPRVNSLNAPYYRHGGLDRSALLRGVKVLERSLRNLNYLTRDALGSELAKVGLPLKGQSLAYLMMFAELEGVVCSGASRSRGRSSSTCSRFDG